MLMKNDILEPKSKAFEFFIAPKNHEKVIFCSIYLTKIHKGTFNSFVQKSHQGLFTNDVDKNGFSDYQKHLHKWPVSL